MNVRSTWTVYLDCEAWLSRAYLHKGNYLGTYPGRSESCLALIDLADDVLISPQLSGFGPIKLLEVSEKVFSIIKECVA